MILIFDLDDTLYPEITYVKSGFLAVSDFIFKKFDLDKDLSYKILLKILKRDGRGKIFDSFLKENNIYSKKNVKECISIYRNHTPYINLYRDARKCIKRFKDFKIE